MIIQFRLKLDNLIALGLWIKRIMFFYWVDKLINKMIKKSIVNEKWEMRNDNVNENVNVQFHWKVVRQNYELTEKYFFIDLSN